MARHPLFRQKSITRILSDVKRGFGDEPGLQNLQKNLSVRDLTVLGIAAIIGAGLFSTIGEAASTGGPAISLLFVFTALACGFAALCYAEFASAIPISGSAYTYAYASFGELVAWIIGWDLLVEYAIGNIAVAISWSDYFTELMAGLQVHIPAWMSTDYLTAARGHDTVQEILNNAGAGMQSAVEAFQQSPTVEGLKALAANPADATKGLVESFRAWEFAPDIAGMRMIFDMPALFITLLITSIVYVGIRESKRASNILVLIKMLVIVLVIGVGAFYVDTDNWSPFAPEGFGGVMKGVAGVFFAYIGFDSLSTMAEETKNPRRDLPRAMMYTLIICTVLYIIVSLVLTGVAPYKALAVGDPMAEAFNFMDLPEGWLNALKGIVAVGAVVATASVLLVFQMGQPRIFMSMSRDGLLPKRFSKIHPKFRTPGFATIITGIMVAVPVFFMNLSEVTDLTSIGTLFAFVLVCGGVLVQQQTAGEDYQPRFRVWYFNGKYILPLLYIITWVILLTQNSEGLERFFSFSDEAHGLGWSIGKRVPMLLFLLVATWLPVLAFLRSLSLIPSLGLLICFYLMAEVEAASWYRFLAWLALGLLIYFLYGQKHSKLNTPVAEQPAQPDENNDQGN